MVLPTRLGLITHASVGNSINLGPIPNVPAGFIRTGDVWIAGFRANANFTNIADLVVPSGWTILAQSGTGQNAQVIAGKLASDAERAASFTFSGWATSLGQRIQGFFALYEGIDWAASRLTNVSTGLTVPERRLLRTPSITIAYTGHWFDAGVAAASSAGIMPASDGWERDSRISSTNMSEQRVNSVLGHKVYPNGTLGRVPAETWATPAGASVPRTVSVTLAGSDTNRTVPSIQPLNWYRGNQRANVYRGTERLF